MKTFFDAVAPLYEKLRPGARGVFEKITNLVEFKQSDKIIDIGGGTGAIAQFFVGKVDTIEVVDPSSKMIERCRRHSGISCAVGSGESLPFANKSVDKVILVDALHHITDQEKTIQEIKRVLKKDGTAIIAEYNPESFGGNLIVLLEKLLRLGSIFHTPSQLTATFAKHGFSVQIIDEGKKDYFLIAKML